MAQSPTTYPQDKTGRNITDGLMFMPSTQYGLHQTKSKSRKSHVKSSAVPDSDLSLINRLNNLFIIARDYKRARYETWLRNYRLTNNRWGNVQAAAWMPAPRDSEIYPVLSSLVAWMTDQSVSLDFVPQTDPYSTFYSMVSEIANDLSDVIYAAWLIYNYDAQTKLSLWDAFQYGTGILKSVWDGSRSGGIGDVMLRRVDPWSFYPSPYATTMEDGEYFCEVHRFSYDELERRYGPDVCARLPRGGSSWGQIDERPTLFSDTGARAPMANPGPLPGGQPRYGQAKATNPSMYDPYPTYIVYEFWIKENRVRSTNYNFSDVPVYTETGVESDWRVICVCGNVVLMDEMASDLWSWGGHPYDRFCFDDTGEFWGIALVDHLAYPQIYINRLLTALEQNAELVGNPILIESEASGSARTTIYNRPGMRIPVRGAGGLQMNKPEWLDPPSMPPAVMQLVQFWIERLQNTAGFSAINQNMPNQRNAADVIQSVQEAAFVRIRAAQQNLEWTLQSAAMKLGDLVVENYTEDRYVAALGEDGQPAQKLLRGRHFQVPGKGHAMPLKFVIQVNAGASAPTSRQARISEAEHLFALGAVDDEYVLGVHQVRHAKEILQRLYQKRTSGLIGVPGQRQRSGRSS